MFERLGRYDDEGDLEEREERRRLFWLMAHLSVDEYESCVTALLKSGNASDEIWHAVAEAVLYCSENGVGVDMLPIEKAIAQQIALGE